MRKILLFSIPALAILSLLLILSNCSGSGSAGGECKIVNGKKECSLFLRAQINFSPKPQEFDEVFVLDLMNKFELLDQTIPVNVVVKSDTGYTQKVMFKISKNTARMINTVKPNFAAHVFTPVNKPVVDKFIKDALANTNHTLNATITLKFTTDGTLVKGKEIFWQPNDIGLRIRFAQNQEFMPIKIKPIIKQKIKPAGIRTK